MCFCSADGALSLSLGVCVSVLSPAASEMFFRPGGEGQTSGAEYSETTLEEVGVVGGVAYQTRRVLSPPTAIPHYHHQRLKKVNGPKASSGLPVFNLCLPPKPR